ncbi:MAG: hypothetical protein U9P61_01855 [Patescibacteria group bacterium]|nr:hypothetical protein [Patescibacteria group bacterium]
MTKIQRFQRKRAKQRKTETRNYAKLDSRFRGNDKGDRNDKGANDKGATFGKFCVVSRSSFASFRASSHREDDGFVALTSVIIINAFIVVLFIGMFFSATEQIERADDREFSTRALGLANSCAEVALNELKNDLAYTGNEIVTVGAYSCNILELDGTDMAKVIKTTGAVNGYTKRVQIEVDTFAHPYLEIIDWRVVSEFADM